MSFVEAIWHSGEKRCGKGTNIPGGALRILLWFLASLAVAIAIGCSRQPPLLVGEWESVGGWLGGGWHARIYFYEDGTFQKTVGHDIHNPVWVENGYYKVDYSKNPIEIDLSVDHSGVVSYGILRFFGNDRNKMQLLFTTTEEARPNDFPADQRHNIWTKNVKK